MQALPRTFSRETVSRNDYVQSRAYRQWVRILRPLGVAFAIAVIALFILFGLATGAPPVLPALLTAGIVVVTLWVFRGRLPDRLRPHSVLGFVTVFWAALFVSAALLDFSVNMPVTIGERTRIAAELNAIVQPQLSRRLAYNEYTKTSTVTVEATYRAAAATWGDLRAHFDRALEADGWSFVEERGIREWGQDYGGRSACYVRGPDRASVWFPGRVDADYTYSFSIAWQIGGRAPC